MFCFNVRVNILNNAVSSVNDFLPVVGAVDRFIRLKMADDKVGRAGGVHLHYCKGIIPLIAALAGPVAQKQCFIGRMYAILPEVTQHCAGNFQVIVTSAASPLFVGNNQ